MLITDLQFLDQMEAVRDLPAGVPLRQTDIRPAVLVRQGQWVTMTVGHGSGFTITVRLEALQDGRLGERVMLRNTESGRTVSGVVTGMTITAYAAAVSGYLPAYLLAAATWVVAVLALRDVLRALRGGRVTG